MKRPLLAAGAAAAALLIGLGFVVFGVIGGLVTNELNMSATGGCAPDDSSVVPAGSTGAQEYGDPDDPFGYTGQPTAAGLLAELDAAQVRNARTIIAVGRELGVAPRGWVVALATARQEAGIRNLASRANPGSLDFPHDGVAPGDHDSVGIFQQRDAWGPMAVRMDVEASARMFYLGGRAGQRGLVDVPGWPAMSIAEAAQAVQVSAFPTAYAQWEDLAFAIVEKYADGAEITQAGMTPDTAAACGVVQASGTVVHPMPASAAYVDNNNWGNAGGNWARGHTGNDYSAACGTPVLAAHAGTIEIDTTQAWSGPWLVKVTTGPRSLATWYAHMQALTVDAGDQVIPGQQIGEVGTLGNSTGCHLHFEVHPRNGSIYEDNVDPVAWLKANIGRQVTAPAVPASSTGGITASAWNLRVNRSPERVVDEVAAWLRREDIDLLTVQEANQYVAALRRELAGAYTVVYDDTDRSAMDSAVIVRDGYDLADPTLHRLERRGWPRTKGPGMHWPRSATSVDVEDVRVMSVHLPPGGPDARTPGNRVAYRTSMDTIGDYAAALNGPWLFVGDWNAAPRRDGPGSPAELAARVGATTTGDRIDWAMARGLTITDMRRVRYGTSDHDPILFTVQ